VKEFNYNTIKEENLKFKSGIYRIIINKKSYIGSSVNLDSRLREHLGDFNTNNHINKKLLNAYNKYKQVFFEIVEFCEEINLIEREDYYYKIEGYYNLQSPYKLYNKQSKIVYQYNLEGNLLNTYISTGDASRKTKIHQTAISGACNNKLRSYANGYLWSYKLEVGKKRLTGIAKPVYMYDLNGKFIKEFYSCYNAARYIKEVNKLNNTVGGIASVIKTSIVKNGTKQSYNFLFTNFKADEISPLV